MTIRDRAAATLDATHDKTNVGIHTLELREIVAAWLDGRKIKTSFVRKSVDYLEMIARTA